MSSTRLSARAVAVPALALVLAGASYAPALADDHGKSGHAHGKSGADHAKSSGKSSDKASGKTSDKAGSSGTSASQDPPGNNGTFKVDGLPYDDGKGNEPHVSCGFRLKFYGFDAGQTGDITITGQAPSGSGLVSSKTGVLISDDAAGGGNDLDALVPYTADDLDLAGLTAHPKQGYHLKVTLSTDTPGGVKHKVFWYEPCATAPETPGTPGGTGGTGTEVGGTGGTVTPPVVGGTVTPPSNEVTQPRTDVLGERLDREATPAAPATQVLGARLTRTAGLPFTGSFTTALLAVAGGLLAAGGAVLTLARRRRLT
jgi:hypothetical protein